MKKLVLALAMVSILFNACKKEDTTPASTGSTTLTVEKKNRAAVITLEKIGVLHVVLTADQR